jgi:hypothetical protein
MSKQFSVISATFYRLLNYHVNVMHYLDVTQPFNEKFPWYVSVYLSWCSIPQEMHKKHLNIMESTDASAENGYTKTFISFIMS